MHLLNGVDGLRMLDSVQVSCAETIQVESYDNVSIGMPHDSG